jgi:hypothetical protein
MVVEPAGKSGNLLWRFIYRACSGTNRTKVKKMEKNSEKNLKPSGVGAVKHRNDPGTKEPPLSSEWRARDQS